MAKLTFSPEALRKGLAIARLVKPMTGDFVMKISGGKLSIFSSDRRKFARAEVTPLSSDVANDFESDEYFLPMDRQAFFDSNLDSVMIVTTEKGLTVKTEGQGQSRQASIKKRADLSRRPPMPNRITIAGGSVKASSFEELIRQVSCSALVRETKTDDDMRVNQVHFYPEESCAVANARFYATIAMMPGLALDLSIVSADLPIIRSFCSRFGDSEITVGRDKSHLFIFDPDSKSYVAFSRFTSNRPPLSIPSDEYDTIIAVDRDQLVKSLTWCSMAVEGTQRITFQISGERIALLHGSQEISGLPAQFIKGTKLTADFPVKTLCGIIKFIGEGKALLKYGNSQSPSVLEIAEESDDGTVKARHFISSMKEHKA